jgi:hypothetical protein
MAAPPSGAGLPTALPAAVSVVLRDLNRGLPPEARERPEAAGRRFITFFEVPVEGPVVVPVRFIPDLQAFRDDLARNVQRPGAWTGYYDPMGKEIVVGGGEDYLDVLVHEVNHFIVDMVFEEAPVWLNEGLAEYFETSAAEYAHHTIDPSARICPEGLTRLDLGREAPAGLLGRDQGPWGLSRQALAEPWGLSLLVRGDGGLGAPDEDVGGEPAAQAIALGRGRAEAATGPHLVSVERAAQDGVDPELRSELRTALFGTQQRQGSHLLSLERQGTSHPSRRDSLRSRYSKKGTSSAAYSRIASSLISTPIPGTSRIGMWPSSVSIGPS